MAEKVLVIAPHPDDEVLGCGGTLLSYKEKGNEIYWLIVTQMNEDQGFSKDRIQTRNEDIAKVEKQLGFEKVFNLGFPTTRLDSIPLGDIVGSMMSVFNEVKPNIVLVPFRNDAHSDHQVVFDAAFACGKWFRSPTVKEILAYETISETDFSNPLSGNEFKPNVYHDISDHISKKIEILKIYESELGTFPFPRSIESIESLAKLRGTQSGFQRAEAFMLLKQLRSF